MNEANDGLIIGGNVLLSPSVSLGQGSRNQGLAIQWDMKVKFNVYGLGGREEPSFSKLIPFDKYFIRRNVGNAI